MNTHLSPHLTDDEFATYALGEGVAPNDAARLEQHLAACEACRNEVAAFASSVESFNTVSMAWSEAQPAEPLRPLAEGRSPRPTWSVATWVGAGALAGCLATVSVISVAHHDSGHGPEISQASAEAEDTPAQIERDNKLLLAVSEATAAKAASPLQAYGLEDAKVDHARAPQAQDEND